MNPQIVSYDLGQHNGSIEASRARILQGSSWKKTRVIVLIPAADTMASKVALSHWNLIFPPNQAVYRLLCLGMEVGEAYSAAIEQIIAHPDLSKWEFILTIEADNIPPPDGVIKLIDRMKHHPEFACVGGLYWCKGPGGCAHIWGDINDPVVNYRPQPPDPAGGLVECYGTSMGFNLWRLAMFHDARLRRPWFKTSAGVQGVGTQDLYFWGDARRYGYRCAVDCSVLVGHHDHTGSYGPPGMTW